MPMSDRNQSPEQPRRAVDQPPSENGAKNIDLPTIPSLDTLNPGDMRALVKQGREALAEQFRQGVRAADLIHRQSDFIDQILHAIWQQHFPNADGGIALVAVGGYGRAELHPRSDVDILILIDGAKFDHYQHQVEPLVAALWDSGLDIGHSVRSIEECVDEAGRDVTVITNLIECRLLCGDAALYADLCQSISTEHLWPADAFFTAKRDEQAARHRKFRDTAYNLEPNIKEGPGGLRDLQMISWVAKRYFGANTTSELVQHGFLTESEHYDLMRCQDHLWQIRYALHVQTGRNENRLLFDLQRELAVQFGYKDDKTSIAVEKFMQAYYRVITTLSRLNEMLLQIFEEVTLSHTEPAGITPINRRFQSCNGFVEITHPNVFKRYPFALLEIFLLLQQHPELKGVRAQTIRMIRQHTYLIDDEFRDDLRCRSLFLDILRQPSGITHELRRMNRYGVLAAYCPPFRQIVGRMQYDLFHVYTVDEHTLNVVSNVRKFTLEEFANETPLCHEVIAEIPKLEVLYIAAFFHDIAKGRGGNHSELGAIDAVDFCIQHGLSRYDTALVAWLIRQHLAMSQTAQKTDIGNPEVIGDFAREMGDEQHLNHLFLLTVADIRGTNPEIWSNWKATLLNGLYLATRRYLRRGLETPWDRLDQLREQQSQARGRLGNVPESDIDRIWKRLDDGYFVRHSAEEIEWHTRTLLGIHDDAPYSEVHYDPIRGISQVLVYCRDTRHLFAATAVTLDRLGLNIVDARVSTTSDGYALNTFVVLNEENEPILEPGDSARVTDTLTKVLNEGKIPPVNTARRRSRRHRHFDIPTEILFSDDLRHRFTIVELSTADYPGLLAQVGLAFMDFGARLHSARISTFGERVDDIFEITDQNGQALQDEAQMNTLSAIIRERLSVF
ncbi:MAG: [protein-PII] uridylyltransferase [Gammaproteobacteria bacterium]|nr:[protein-PII] uridylyltransferase [Gammaproteobacteria bacterium]